jgi:hypothetical protein
MASSVPVNWQHGSAGEVLDPDQTDKLGWFFLVTYGQDGDQDGVQINDLKKATKIVPAGMARKDFLLPSFRSAAGLCG